MQKNIIICGLDGVLNSFVPVAGSEDLDSAALRPFDDPDPRFSLVWTTLRLIKHVTNNMHANFGEPEVWLITGRSKAVQAQTSAWLMAAGMLCTKFIMREPGDQSTDAEMKLRLLRDGTIPQDRVFCVFDAGSDSAQMWRSEGITCYQSA
jgi:hypothetical protein